MERAPKWLLLFLLTCTPALVGVASAQVTGKSSAKQAAVASEQDDNTIRKLPENLLKDQVSIWTSPFRVRPSDTNWLVPLGIATGSMIATDRWVPQTLDLSASTNDRFNQLSNAGLFGMTAATGGVYLLGHIRHDDYQRRAGFLAGEAMIDSAIVGQVLKVVFNRERPGEGSGYNKFFSGGSSFPSDHSLLTWSSAAALTEAYPGWGSKMILYGGATAVSVSRILANKHAPSDVLVGSALGYLIGKNVYKRHAVDEELLKQYGTFKRNIEPEDHGVRNRASVDVPMDSWVYPAFDRLIALGYVKSGIVGLRPWTRTECARLIDEIPPDIGDKDLSAAAIIDALRSEFSGREQNVAQIFNATVESIYFRGTGITGQPLTDDLNFGGTIVNDFGRPFQDGFNSVAGASAHAEVGSLAFYIRGEYQHAPGAPALPDSARAAVRDGIVPTLPLPPATPTPQVDRLHLLDAYVAWNFSNWQLSFGKQSLWWGPGQNGPMLISDNIDPINMGRISRVVPFTLPWIFKYLGPMRAEMFVGRLSGHHFTRSANTIYGSYSEPLSDQPYLMGQKLSLKPTPNLEIGVSRTGLFGGTGFPVTPSTLRTVFFSTSTSNVPGKDPGDRRSSFNFSYRVPGLRKWLMLYADSMAEDEVNPIAYPRRSAMNPGVYLPQLPKLPHMDFRAEAAYTDLPGLIPADYFYWNLRYLNGYTNAGRIIGNWAAREGKTLQFSSRYWFSAHNKVEVTYRKLGVNPETGRRGTQHNLRASVDWMLSPNLEASGWVQHERWNFPVISPTIQSNTAVSFELTYTPRWRFHK
jgi:membrane-associated phospholipid phosphatase